jgi:hypothetical protein
MRKLLLLAITTTRFIFADCGPDFCNPCKQTDCCSDPCSDCYEKPAATCNTCQCAPCCCQPCDFCPPEPPKTCGYNAPKFYDLKCCWDTFISGSFIYAQAKEENLTYLENTTTVTDTNASKTKFATLSYDYNPAFKVGLGFVMGCDNWDFYAEYIRYHADTAKGSYSATLEDGSFWSPCLYLSPFTASLDALLATTVTADTK